MPDRSKEKSVTVWKLAMWVVIAIILAVTIPKSVRYINDSIDNAARGKAEKAHTLFMIENGANINDYTVFVVHHNNRYYVYWYVDQIKALAGFDDLSGYAPPIGFPAGIEYPFVENPFSTEYKLKDNGTWEVITRVNSDAGFESCFETDEDTLVTYCQFDTKVWREKPPSGVCILSMAVNGDSIRAKRGS